MTKSVTTSDPLLPFKLANLERFSDWILPTEIERNRKRLSSEYSEIKLFYDSMLALKDVWIAHLDQFTISTLPAAEQRLYYLTLSLMEAAIAVEYFQAPDLKNAVPASRLNILSPAYRDV